MDQIAQVIGSLCVLLAFLLLQLKKTTSISLLYIALNIFGSLILGIVALRLEQWGFVLLEFIWAIVSIHTLLHVYSERKHTS